MVHPLLDAVSVIDEALKSVADVNPTFMSTADKAAALTGLVQIASRVAEVRMRVLAESGDLADETASRDAAEWLATRTHVRPDDARDDLALGRAIDRRWVMVGDALRDGGLTVAQAQVIVRALEALAREDVAADVLARAEEILVGHAADFGPRPLARLAARVLEVVAPEIAEAAEARRLMQQEQDAQRRTRLTLRRLGDGTTRLSGRLPDAATGRLATYLEAFANPRRESRHEQDPGERLPYPRRMGEAFCHLLEVVDPRRLPVHGGDATTVIVTIPLDALRSELAAADVIASHVPGDDGPQRLSTAEVRRLACTAKIVPAVLGGASELLDLGRASRLFSAAQRRAMILRDRTCRAEGCDVPGTWCEAHHWVAWSLGGDTDLEDGLLLCSHHHHRAHDGRFTAERMPNGDVRFARRT